MVDPRTAQNLRQWERKPSLRAVYQDLYKWPVSAAQGSRNFKQYHQDVNARHYHRAVAGSGGGCAGHFRLRERLFKYRDLRRIASHRVSTNVFAEAQGVLIPGGRMVIAEPAITPMSRFFYRFVHREPVNLSADPLLEGKRAPIGILIRRTKPSLHFLSRTVRSA